MPTFRSGGARLSYEVTGNGPTSCCCTVSAEPSLLGNSVTPQLSTRYRVILPDLRAHGDSELGEGPATMQKLADDLSRLCREERISKAFFVGVSIGGYLLFEFWRRYRDQVAALVLANTRPGAETSEGKANRLQLADRVLREGTAGFLGEMLSNRQLVSRTTRTNRPDIVDAALMMMQCMSAEDMLACNAEAGAPRLRRHPGNYQCAHSPHRRRGRQHPAQ